MSTINLYTISQEEVISLLHSRYQGLLEHMKKWNKKNSPHLSEDVLETATCAFIYQKCLQKFQYSEYIRSAADALDKLQSDVSNGFYSLDTPDSKSAKTENELDEKIKQYTAWGIISLILFWPLGIYFLYKRHSAVK